MALIAPKTPVATNNSMPTIASQDAASMVKPTIETMSHNTSRPPIRPMNVALPLAMWTHRVNRSRLITHAQINAARHIEVTRTRRARSFGEGSSAWFPRAA